MVVMTFDVCGLPTYLDGVVVVNDLHSIDIDPLCEKHRVMKNLLNIPT